VSGWEFLVSRFTLFATGTQPSCFQRGVPNPKTVIDSMRHGDIKTTMRCIHAISNDRPEAVERATQALFAAFCGELGS
jgi:hypothetical protein